MVFLKNHQLPLNNHYCDEIFEILNNIQLKECGITNRITPLICLPNVRQIKKVFS